MPAARPATPTKVSPIGTRAASAPPAVAMIIQDGRRRLRMPQTRLAIQSSQPAPATASRAGPG